MNLIITLSLFFACGTIQSFGKGQQYEIKGEKPRKKIFAINTDDEIIFFWVKTNIGMSESDIRWLVDILLANEMRNAVCCVHFLDGFSHCLLYLPPPQSFSVLTLVQLSPGFNSYFANHKRKNAPKKLADMQANKIMAMGKGGLQYPCLFVEGIAHFTLS